MVSSDMDAMVSGVLVVGAMVSGAVVSGAFVCGYYGEFGYGEWVLWCLVLWESGVLIVLWSVVLSCVDTAVSGVMVSCARVSRSYGE